MQGFQLDWKGRLLHLVQTPPHWAQGQSIPSFAILSVCMYVCVYTCVYACVYLCTYICIHMHAILQTSMCVKLFERKCIRLLVHLDFSLWEIRNSAKQSEPQRRCLVCWTQSHHVIIQQKPPSFVISEHLCWWIKAWIQSLESIFSFSTGRKRERCLKKNFLISSFGFPINLPLCLWCPCVLLSLRVWAGDTPAGWLNCSYFSLLTLYGRYKDKRTCLRVKQRHFWVS